MNNDRVEDDARFVFEKMQLEYPTLRSEELPAKYGVQGFSTLSIIDKAGKVADVHVGYSPQLFEEVTAAVDRLLD
jgi:thioredoxin-related protein